MESTTRLTNFAAVSSHFYFAVHQRLFSGGKRHWQRLPLETSSKLHYPNANVNVLKIKQLVCGAHLPFITLLIYLSVLFFKPIILLMFFGLFAQVNRGTQLIEQLKTCGRIAYLLNLYYHFPLITWGELVKARPNWLLCRLCTYLYNMITVIASSVTRFTKVFSNSWPSPGIGADVIMIVDIVSSICIIL